MSDYHQPKSSVPQRQFYLQQVSPDQVLGFPGILAEVEKRVRGVLARAGEIDLQWHWEDVHGVWHPIEPENIVARVKAGLVMMVRCAAVEKPRTPRVDIP